jgi:hypothetical protein
MTWTKHLQTGTTSSNATVRGKLIKIQVNAGEKKGKATAASTRAVLISLQ